MKTGLNKAVGIAALAVCFAISCKSAKTVEREDTPTAIPQNETYANGAIKFGEGRAIVRQITGEAHFCAPGEKDAKPLKINAILKPGTKVETNPGAQTDLFLDNNGPVVRITSSSAVTLDKLGLAIIGDEIVIDTRLSLEKGSMLANVKKLAKASRYEIKTPVGVASIRGTQFGLSADGMLTVLEGVVNLYTAETNYVIKVGETLNVEKHSVEVSTPGLTSYPTPETRLPIPRE